MHIFQLLTGTLYNQLMHKNLKEVSQEYMKA